MDSILAHPIVNSIKLFITGHPVLWFCLLIIVLVGIAVTALAKFVPQIDIIKSKILLPIAKKWNHKRLAKSAIKHDIRGHVNKELNRFGKYLPTGWVGEMDVDWVESEDLQSMIDDKKMVVRVRPVKDQDHNFVNATYRYLQSSFFPKTQGVVPKPHHEASVLFICKKIIEGRNSENVKSIFEDHILEPAIDRHGNIPNHLDDYQYIDKRGFFTGTFLRELHLMAMGARFNSGRQKVTQETGEIIKHIKTFIDAYDIKSAGGADMSPEIWSNNGSVSKYSILLVAHPSKTQSGIDQYVNRARSQFISGSHRLYVFGANNENRFATAVISGIESLVEGIRLVERFETPYDYRGGLQGVGAVFESVSI